MAGLFCSSLKVLTQTGLCVQVQLQLYNGRCPYSLFKCIIEVRTVHKIVLIDRKTIFNFKAALFCLST